MVNQAKAVSASHKLCRYPPNYCPISKIYSINLQFVLGTVINRNTNCAPPQKADM